MNCVSLLPSMMIRVQSASFANGKIFPLFSYKINIACIVVQPSFWSKSSFAEKHALSHLDYKTWERTGNGKHTSWESAGKTKACLLTACEGGALWIGEGGVGRGGTGGLDIDHHLDHSHHTSAAYQRIVIWDNIEQFTKRINYDHFVAPINRISPSYLCSVLSNECSENPASKTSICLQHSLFPTLHSIQTESPSFEPRSGLGENFASAMNKRACMPVQCATYRGHALINQKIKWQRLRGDWCLGPWSTTQNINFLYNLMLLLSELIHWLDFISTNHNQVYWLSNSRKSQVAFCGPSSRLN